MALHERILRVAAEQPRHPALIDGSSGAAVDYGTLAERAGAVAGTLAARGFGAGHRLVLWAPNTPAWAGVAVGAMTAGGAVAPVSPAATARELRAAVDTVDPELVVTIPPLAARAREAVEVDVLEIGPELLAAAPVAAVAVDADRTALLPFSSGTTGLPKAVELTHGNLLASVDQLQERIRLTPRDVVLAVAPFAHIMGSVVTLAAPLCAGATVVTLPRFDLAPFLDAIVRHAVTFLTVPPPLVSLLATHPAVDLSRVEVVACGGAPLPPQVQRALQERFPHLRIGQAYGMTETSVLVTAPDRAHGTVPGTVGPPSSRTEVRIAPDGELHVRGPHVMAGYFREPERTREVLGADGWLRTGDLARLRDDGALEIVGRAKELIKVNGHQVAPAELEALLLEHPEVRDAAVAGAPDERRGETPVAFVVGSVDPEELAGWVAEQVAPYKRLSEVRLVESLPRTPSGKLLRRLLAEQLDAVAV